MRAGLKEDIREVPHRREVKTEFEGGFGVQYLFLVFHAMLCRPSLLIQTQTYKYHWESMTNFYEPHICNTHMASEIHFFGLENPAPEVEFPPLLLFALLILFPQGEEEGVTVVILDRGHLICRILLGKNNTFETLEDNYVRYLISSRGRRRRQSRAEDGEDEEDPPPAAAGHDSKIGGGEIRNSCWETMRSI